MGNYISYLTYSEETVPVSMEITDSDSEDTQLLIGLIVIAPKKS